MSPLPALRTRLSTWGAAVGHLGLIVGTLAVATLVATLVQAAVQGPRASVVYLVAVMICAARLGARYGILTALLAALTSNYVFGPAPFHLAFGTRQDLFNLIVFLGGACVTGLYGDELRTGREALLSLSRLKDEVDRPGTGAIWTHIRPMSETARAAAAVGLVLLAGAIGLGLQEGFGIDHISGLYLASIIVAAVMLGARFAMLAAVIAVVLFDYLSLEPRFTLALNTGQAAVNAFIYLGVAWGLGGFADRMRYERKAVRILFTAGHTLSWVADESALLNVICRAVAATNDRGEVRVLDEAGQVRATHGSLPAARAAGEWRTCGMTLEDRYYGVIQWRSPRRLGRGSELAGTVQVLADLGAAALARARAGEEKAKIEALARTDQLRRALLASVSHDLRTPLAGILGGATSLIDYDHGPEVRRDLLMNIREQAHRLNRYVENLLDMTRLEAGVIAPRLERASLEPLVFDVWQQVLSADPQRKAEIEIDERLHACLDPGLFSHALGNLLENAAKFSPRERPIFVHAEQCGDMIELAVRDEGPGVLESEIERLFIPFFRGKSQAGGVGLGLFIAKSFTEAMGGAIKAGPRRDGHRGFEVILTLPMERPA